MSIKKILKSTRGEGYIDVIVIVISSMLVVALAVSVFPAFVTKHNLDTFAHELCREAEIAGRISTETTNRATELKARLGVNPTISWTKTGNVQLNQEFTVTVTQAVDIGFGGFGSFPITLTAKATGKSEVYHK